MSLPEEGHNTTQILTTNKNEQEGDGVASLMIAYRLYGRKVLVIGGGKVATERTTAALEAGANVTLVAPEDERLAKSLRELAQAKRIEWIPRLFTPESKEDQELLHSADMVLSTIDDTATSEAIAAISRKERIPVNCADIPHLCDFWFMSVHREGPLQVGVSTNGNGPRLSSLLRQHIARSLPQGSGDAVANFGQLRKEIRKIDPATTSVRRRMKWLSELCDNTSIEDLARLDERQIEELVEQYAVQDAPQVQRRTKPRVTLLGAGPGNPELLTLAGRKALESAEVILADALIPEPILDIVRNKGAELIIAKKHEEGADNEQQRLNECGVEALKRGKHVLRLKGGDPFLFARGGEEILWYRQHGFDVDVIPGVSSVFAAPAAAGIPITHRGVAEQILILTAYGRGGAAPTIPPFMATRTLVFLMTAARASFIASKLMDLGYPDHLPAAIVENATLPYQRTFYARLGSLGEVALHNQVTHPATIIVGNVVSVLHQELYYEKGTEKEKEIAAATQPLPVPLHQAPVSLPPAAENVAAIAAKKLVQPYPTSPVLPPTMKAIDITDEHLAFLNQRLSGRTPQQILMWCFDTLPGLVQVTSFGPTGMVILDMMSNLGLSMPCIFLDTLYHFEETLEHAYLMEKKYRLKLNRYHCHDARNHEEFEELYGKELWLKDDKRYDYLVKVEPLERALKELNVRAWITGRRRDQGGLRANVEVLEFDIDGRLKVNILANWSWEDVWDYLREHKVPYNPLHDKNYKSVGDWHSTRPVSSNEDERSGRFFHQKEKTECGIHNRWKYVKSLPQQEVK